MHIAFLIENIVKNVKITIIQSTFKIGLKHAGWNIRAGGIFFLKINKRADPNKTVQEGIALQN